MLEQVDVDKKMSKDEYEKKMESLSTRLGELQRKCKEQKIPVMVTFDGVDAAGKGTMINRVIQFLDPRGYRVFTTGKAGEEEKMRPYFWRFFTKTPEKGRMHIFDQSWYRGVYEGEIGEKDATEFEKMLIQDGTLIVKFFLLISAKEQKKRLEKMEKDEDTRWRVSDFDKWQNEHYKKCAKIFSQYLSDTNASSAPWYIIDASDRKWAELQVLETMVSNIEVAMQNQAHSVPILQNVFPLEQIPRLSDIDLRDKTMDDEEYRGELKQLQSKLGELHNKLYRRRIPVIITYEGWDAAGKGGNIKRITEALDPRGYEVHPIASPEPHERPDIIYGVSGQEFRKMGISLFLTEPGMAELW